MNVKGIMVMKKRASIKNERHYLYNIFKMTLLKWTTCQVNGCQALGMMGEAGWV